MNTTPGTDFGPSIDLKPLRLPLSATSSSETTKRPRPTYVALPSPQSFDMDVHPTSTSLSSYASGRSPSPRPTIDSSYIRESPTTPSAGTNINAGLPVLVVDDDSLTRTLMKRILTRLGCNVETAENGEIALDMILGTRFHHVITPTSDVPGNLGPILEQEQRPPELAEEGKYAVIFLDNQMPVMSGLVAVQKLREIGRKDLVVGVTGQSCNGALWLSD
jgi:osomolarity two-component system sensor histidine kinase SLN1